MNNRFIRIFLVFLMLIITCIAEGQSKRVPASAAKYKYFQIPGRVKLDKGDPSGTVVNLINLDSKQTEKSISVPSSGKFDLELSFFKEYKISVSKNGYYDKEIEFSTVIPPNVWEKDSIFPPFYIVVTLYKKVDGARLSFEGKTIGKVSYSPNGTLDNFDSKVLIDDKAIQDEINDAIKNNGDEVFNQKVAEALEYEKKDDLSTAYTLYSEAGKLKPSDKFVKEKLKELASDLKNLGNEVKIQAEFNRLIAFGDANVVSLKYPEAIQNYKGALKIKPNDPIAVSKLADAEKLLALAGDKAKKDAEFNRLIAAGDENVKQTKYAEAITSFKAALDIRSGDSMAMARIANAEKLLSLAGDKAKKDAEFNRLITVGDESVKQTKYAEAITSFKAALDIRSGDSMALARIADAEKLLALAGDKAKKDTEKLLALAGDKAKKDAEFNRLITVGDESVKQTKYAEAITSFKAALDIRSGDSMVLARIVDAEKLLALAGDKAKKDAEFNLLISSGNSSVSNKKYAEALTFYKSALKIKSNEVVIAKIAEAERFLQLDETERVRIETERQAIALKQQKYNDEMNRGGTYFTARQYSEAILAYREAQKIKPSETLPAEKIKEIQSIINALAAKSLDDNKLSGDEKLYSEKIKIADENFKKSQWSVARFYFIEALKIRLNDSYSLGKVDACDKMIDSGITSEKMQDYTNKIARADDEMKTKNYTSARFYYRGASDILKWETYPLQQLKEIDRIVAEKLNESDQRLYTENLNKAEDAFNRKEYPVARFYYNKAVEISQSDHIASRLNEIESIVNGSESKKINAAYDDFIKKGDEAVKQNNSSIARFYFQKALALKMNENYPKEEIRKIDLAAVKP